MSPIRSFVLVAFAVAAVALTTPHYARLTTDHAALAARLTAHEPSLLAAEPQSQDSRRTRRHMRCNAPVASSAVAAASSSSAPAAAAASSSAPINVESAPPVGAAPAATTQESAAPASSTTPPAAPPASTSTPAAPSQPTSTAPGPATPGTCGPMSLTGTMTGDATFYSTGLGACGVTNHDTDYIVAVSEDLYDTFPGYAGPGTNPNNNPICGKKIEAHYNGNSVLVTVVDRCTGCACGSLDFSPSAFSQLGNQAAGRLHGMTWSFV